jgi:hypothetical protein
LATWFSRFGFDDPVLAIWPWRFAFGGFDLAFCLWRWRLAPLAGFDGLTHAGFSVRWRSVAAATSGGFGDWWSPHLNCRLQRLVALAVDGFPAIGGSTGVLSLFGPFGVGLRRASPRWFSFPFGGSGWFPTFCVPRFDSRGLASAVFASWRFGLAVFPLVGASACRPMVRRPLFHSTSLEDVGGLDLVTASVFSVSSASWFRMSTLFSFFLHPPLRRLRRLFADVVRFCGRFSAESALACVRGSIRGSLWELPARAPPPPVCWPRRVAHLHQPTVPDGQITLQLWQANKIQVERSGHVLLFAENESNDTNQRAVVNMTMVGSRVDAQEYACLSYACLFFYPLPHPS